jgi:hypothetical protein
MGGPRTAHLTKMPAGAVEGPVPSNVEEARNKAVLQLAPLCQFISEYHQIGGQKLAGMRFFPAPGMETSQGLARQCNVTGTVAYTGPLFNGVDPNTGNRIPIEIRLGDTRFVKLNFAYHADPRTRRGNKGGGGPQGAFGGPGPNGPGGPGGPGPSEPDLNNVSTFMFKVQHYDNQTPGRLQLALNFEHQGFANANQEMLDLQAGRKNVLRGHFLEMLPNTKTDCNTYGLKPQKEYIESQKTLVPYHILTPAFISTTGRITLENLVNGLVWLPDAVVQASGLQQTLPEHKISLVKRWFLLPANHVLAWCLGSDEKHRKTMNVHCQILDDGTKPPGPWGTGPQASIMYYCVCDMDIQSLVHGYAVSFHGKCDNRALADMGFRLSPIQLKKEHALPEYGSFSFTFQLSFMTWPSLTLEQIQALGAALDPNMQPFLTFVPIGGAQ